MSESLSRVKPCFHMIGELQLMVSNGNGAHKFEIQMRYPKKSFSTQKHLPKIVNRILISCIFTI